MVLKKEKYLLVQKTLQSILMLEKEDTIKNHLLTVFSRNFEIQGTVLSNKFTFWQYSLMFGAFYGILTGTVDNEGKVKVEAKLNPVGKIIAILIYIALIGGTLNLIYNLIFVEGKFVLYTSLFGIVFCMLPLGLFKIMWIYEKTNTITDFKEKLESTISQIN